MGILVVDHTTVVREILSTLKKDNAVTVPGWQSKLCSKLAPGFLREKRGVGQTDPAVRSRHEKGKGWIDLNLNVDQGWQRVVQV